MYLPRPIACFAILVIALSSITAEIKASDDPTGLLFYLSGDHGTTADYSAGSNTVPNFDHEISSIADGAKSGALRSGNLASLAYWAPGNIYAQRGTLSFFFRSHTPVGPTAFPIFRVGFADHSSWDMVFLRIDYNGHGFDAFVTDASLSRIRVSTSLQQFPNPNTWTHITLSWDETRGIRFYVNGVLAASKEVKSNLNLALDQFGPNSRIIAPWQVQSDYNFVRGEDIDEVRIYDHMLSDESVAVLANKTTPSHLDQIPTRDLANSMWQEEWALRYGWNRSKDLPAYLKGSNASIRKVEIHDAYDLKRWYWKACDGIRETTWPGVYNRSRLPGRNDYFQLPDWDCYSLSGKSITFTMPDEPWNHIEISGAAYGHLTLLADPKLNPSHDTVLFERPEGQERTIHTLEGIHQGGKVRFDNEMQEQPIGEFCAYYITESKEPEGTLKLSYTLTEANTHTEPLNELNVFVEGRFPKDEQARMLALPAAAPVVQIPQSRSDSSKLPIVHVLLPYTTNSPGYDLNQISEGLDGIALDLPALNTKPQANGLIALNIQVKDPLWTLRNMLDFTFSVKPGESKTLWLDLRDRILPHNKSIYLSVASSSPNFSTHDLVGTHLRLIFKSKVEAKKEHELDRFTQLKDSYAMLVEEHPNTDKLHLWTRFKADLLDLMRVNPNHYPGANYWAVNDPQAPAVNFNEPKAPNGVPLWAFRQVEALGHVKYFAKWWIENRQVENGEYGGGLSDDTDLTNAWPGIALMGCIPDQISKSLKIEIDACYRQGMITNGLSTIQADELHGYEEGLNCLGQNLILNYGSPKMLERAMTTAKRMEWLTATNSAGNRLFQSCYYNGLKMATDSVWGYTKSYEYLILQPEQLLIEYNGNSRAKQLELEMADGLLAHRHLNSEGQYALPASIHFIDDKEGATARGYFPWPLFWSAYKWTGNNKYLDPIFDGGAVYLGSVNANVIDLLNLRKRWANGEFSSAKYIDASIRPNDARSRGRTNSIGNGDSARQAAAEHMAWILTGDKSHLEKLYLRELKEMNLGEYIDTEGSLWIDRVGVPHTNLQRERLGGVALVRNGTFPGHVISWNFKSPANDQSVAILVPRSTPTSFKVIAYNLETSPVQATMTGWNIDPGKWAVTQGTDSEGHDEITSSSTHSLVSMGRSQSIELTLPARATTILTFELKEKGTPYWNRPDLGLDREDVQINGREIRVKIHSLGSVATPQSSIVFKNTEGRIVSREIIPSIEAPLDLEPKTAEIWLTLPDGMNATGGTIEINPEQSVEEITRLNNTVKL